MQNITSNDPTRFKLISDQVLQNFVRSIGWNSADYFAADIGTTITLDNAPGLIIESGNAFIGRLDNAKGIGELYLFLALFLDQRCVRLENLHPFLIDLLMDKCTLAYLLEGRALLREGKYVDAVDSFMCGIENDPTVNDLHREIALVFRRQGRNDEAATHFNLALSLPRQILIKVHAKLVTHPVLMARPQPNWELYYYRQSFYIYKRTSKSAGVIAFEDDLFHVRNNFSYRLVRVISNISFMRRLRNRLFPTTMMATSVVGLSPTKTLDPGMSWRGVTLKLLTSALRRYVLRLFAQPINMRARTISEALKMAHDDASKLNIHRQLQDV